MAILGCVLLHLPDVTPAASTSGTCGIGGARSAPRNAVLRAFTIGLLPVSSVEILLSSFRRIETQGLPCGAPGTIPLPWAARASSAVGVTVRSERLRPDAGALAGPFRTKSGGDATIAASGAPACATPRRLRRLASVASTLHPVRFGALLCSSSLVIRAGGRRGRVDSSRHPVVAGRDAFAGARRARHGPSLRAIERQRSLGADRSSFVAHRRVRSAYHSISGSDDRFSILRRWKDDPTGNYPHTANSRVAVAAVPSRYELSASASCCAISTSASYTDGQRGGVLRPHSERAGRRARRIRPEATADRDPRRVRSSELASL